MSTCAVVAQKHDHHPEWFNAFDRVVVDLTTDDAGGVSALDFALFSVRDGEGGPPDRGLRREPREESMPAGPSSVLISFRSASA